MKTPKIGPAQIQLIGLIGTALLTSQRCERILAETVEWARLPGVKITSKSDLSEMNQKHLRMTLEKLRKVLLSEFKPPRDFLKRLKKFTTNRNRFIHRAFWDNGFVLTDDAKCKSVRPFVEALIKESESLGNFLSASTFSAYKATGRKISAELCALYEEFPKPFVPLSKLFPPR